MRVYDPDECDEQGVPLDWERCRTCKGAGEVQFSLTPAIDPRDPACETREDPCGVCEGHGSLKKAALAHFSLSLPHNAAKHFAKGPEGASGWLCGTPEWRCGDCGHPMNEGTWVDPPLAEWLGFVETRERGRKAIMRGVEPLATAGASQHYSPCDEVCAHGGAARARDSQDGDTPGEWTTGLRYVTGIGERLRDVGGEIEASWRLVNVRWLGWPHDIRHERLAVLCLRCLADRKSS